MRLSDDEFLGVVAKAPLVSIDLVVRDPAGRILMGRRVNEPARDCWFVPGGCIHKGETLDIAFGRIAAEETGVALGRADSSFLGVFEHHYDSNFREVPGIRTHYVVLAYSIDAVLDEGRAPVDQHRGYRWFSREEAESDPTVHRYMLPYFAAVG